MWLTTLTVAYISFMIFLNNMSPSLVPFTSWIQRGEGGGGGGWLFYSCSRLTLFNIYILDYGPYWWLFRRVSLRQFAWYMFGFILNRLDPSPDSISGHPTVSPRIRIPTGQVGQSRFPPYPHTFPSRDTSDPVPLCFLRRRYFLCPSVSDGPDTHRRLSDSEYLLSVGQGPSHRPVPVWPWPWTPWLRLQWESPPSSNGQGSTYVSRSVPVPDRKSSDTP